ncbi:Monoglyceride lipase [Porphyridium purpureum]|uniref:Monoglyceride lipase n=1 Tax=Porphyridium purpureum TaxID=35688 RepID=A0A5J4Z8B2_PORPP|nr:Monoglyceride lipase [Porphyridium purpureum]|eukprot:POR3954..scf295_1
MRLFTNSRGQRIFAQQWLPRRRSDARRKRREKDTNSPRFKGALFIIHGLNAHSNRYSTLVRQFVAKDYAVFAHDLCGHGRSDGLRAYTSSFNHYIADARMYVQDVVSRNRLQAIPKFLVGHSLGGALAIRLARDDADRARRLGALPPWDGVLLTAPAVAVFPKPLVKLFAPILGTLFPFMRVQSLKARRNFSTSPETTDPLIMTAGVRARVGYEILKSCSEIMNSASSFSTALFIAHAKADRVTSMQGSQRFVERAGSRVKTFRLYDSHVHDLLGNPGLAAQVSRDMLEWVEERVGKLAKDS